MSDDPFTQVYIAIWTALSNSAGFAALVKPGNRMNMADSSFKKFRDELTSVEVPEVILAQSEFQFSPGLNAKTVGMSQSYPLLISNNELQVGTINAVKWAAMAALQKAGGDLGLPFVRGWTISNATDAMKSPQDNRGGDRMTALLLVNVEMYWPKTDLPE